MDLTSIPAPVWGVLGVVMGSVIGPVFVAIIQNRTATKTNQPAMLEAASKYFSDLLKAQGDVIDELRGQIGDLTKKVEDQSKLIEEMSAHIASLEAQIQSLGAIPVSRKRAKSEPAVA